MKNENKNLRAILDSYNNCGSDKEILMPSILILETSSKCNIACIYCPTHSCKEKGFMNINMFRSIITQSAGFVKSIMLYYRGEPLLNNNLIDMIKLIKRETSAREDFEKPN